MTQLTKDLKAVAKSLKSLTLKTERLAKKVDKIEKAQKAKKTKAKVKATRKKAVKKTARKAVRRPKKKAVRRPAGKVVKKASAIDTVLKIIQRRKKGVTTPQIKAMTGYGEKKIWDIVNRAKRQGKVKSISKGVYVKA